MPTILSTASWLSVWAVAVVLAIALFAALLTGSLLQIGAHAGLLVGGSAIALALRPPHEAD